MATVAVPTTATQKSSPLEVLKKAVSTAQQSLTTAQQTLVTKSRDAYSAAQPYFKAAKPYTPVVVGAIAAGSVLGIYLARRQTA